MTERPAKRRRKKLTQSEKCDIVIYKEKHPKATQDEVFLRNSIFLKLKVLLNYS